MHTAKTGQNALQPGMFWEWMKFANPKPKPLLVAALQNTIGRDVESRDIILLGIGTFEEYV